MAHIFVVDDDEQLLRMVGLMLERGGHTATLVSNPIEALDMMREEAPDLAILDVMMPGMNGLELCQELRMNPGTREIPIIVLTARGPIESRQEAIEIGADTYLNKPVTSIELLSNVEDLIARKSGGALVQDDDLVESDTTSQSGSAPCQTIALFGFSGGIGRTTLSVNLALELNKQFHGKVCLVDLTTSGGQAAMQLRMQPTESWDNLLSLSDISGLQIGKQVVEHESGLRILPAPLMPRSPDIMTISALKKIYSTLITSYQYVIFDLPAVLTPLVKFILSKVTVGLHVVRPEVMAVQTAIRVEKRMLSKGPMPANRYFVLNQSSPDAKLEAATVKRGLNTDIEFQVMYDRNQMKAVHLGKPLALDNESTVLVDGVTEIAQKMSELILVKTP